MKPRDERPGLPARRAAVSLLRGVIEGGEPLGEVPAELNPADRALARAIVMTVLRRHGELEAIIARHMARPLPAKAVHARLAMLAAAAQILYMRVPAHAAIDLAVRLIKADGKTRHLAGLANAVLRKVATEAVADEPDGAAAAANMPGWLMARWRRTYGDAGAEAIALAQMDEPPLDITVKAGPEAWAERLGGTVLATGTVRIGEPKGPVEALAGYGEGAWWVQDAAAALPARLAGDVAGKRVFDLCAAPGGKTMQLAAAGAAVTVVDVSAARLQRLRENLARVRLPAEIVTGDVLAFAPEEAADVVLLDAPCSATGTIRRHPDVKFLKSARHIGELAKLQDRLLSHAVGLVRPGGVLIYCTCSLEPEEGEARIAAFLAARDDFSPVPVTADELSGLGGLIDAAGQLRTLPSSDAGGPGGMDGFFAARLIRNA